MTAEKYEVTDAEVLFSPCKRYRYSLGRTWGGAPGDKSICWVMLNPSTADLAKLDPTLRRCRDFTFRLGGYRMQVVNLYALRSTDPAMLWKVEDPVGPSNDGVVEFQTRTADLTVVAWGANAKADRVKKIDRLLRGRNVIHLGTLTAEGHPRHPLYLRKDIDTSKWLGFGRFGA